MGDQDPQYQPQDRTGCVIYPPSELSSPDGDDALLQNTEEGTVDGIGIFLWSGFLVSMGHPLSPLSCFHIYLLTSIAAAISILSLFSEVFSSSHTAIDFFPPPTEKKPKEKKKKKSIGLTACLARPDFS